ncbi:helix-turn-helix domain-containing protein [Kitasatospora sp. NPDC048407]|uniref:AlbA family DNA-binding domain-containing protein n=1 Tax=Kitasatospora sp. NPDC048407 TaxID=3364051 RepID=UPI00371373B2
MTASEQVDVDGLAELVRGCEDVRARLVLVTDAEGQWRLYHGEVLLDAPDLDTGGEETWLYPAVAFVARRLRGWVVADLLRGKPANIDRFRVFADQQWTHAAADDLHGNQAWTGRTTPWPRTEWTIRRDSTDYRNYGVLVGDTSHPSFLTFDQAVSSFLCRRPHDSRITVDQLWRVIQPRRGAWFRKVTVAPDRLTVDLEGDDLDDVVLELSEPAGSWRLQVEGADSYDFDLPEGLRAESLLIAHRGGKWLDMRHFPAAPYGSARDTSVVWEQPELELELLLADGEGPRLECKREIPKGDPRTRKKMLKTVAAFASQPGGGTILFGIEDDNLEIVGLAEDQSADEQQRQIVDMIRKNLEPAPACHPRVIKHNYKRIIAVDVPGGNQPCAYREGERLEFYVRRGSSSIFASYREIEEGFRLHPGTV